MANLTTSPLKMSNVFTPEGINEKLYGNKKRTIWTPDGEYQVPVKKKKKTPKAWQARVSDIWFKDEKGELLLYDPLGESNTITNGAIFEMMHALWGSMVGYTNNEGASAFATPNSNAVNYNKARRSPYNDGTYNFPTLENISETFYNNSTYALGMDYARPYQSLFGQLAFINGSSGGLTGDHIPATITFGTGFQTSQWNSPVAATGNGWNDSQGLPTTPIGSTNTTLSDSFSIQASGTPTMSHSMVLSAAAGAKSFTFDGIAWLPIVGYAAATGGRYGGYWAGGTTYTANPVWASANNTSPTTQAQLQVSALWNPGYAITLNPGGSWGFTYSFQG